MAGNFVIQLSIFFKYRYLAASSLGQQLQQDPNDPTKWQVVTTGGAPQGTQLVTVSASTNSNQVSSPTQPETTMEVVMTTEATPTTATATPAKPRLRRVACTCPNCKDGEGKQ